MYDTRNRLLALESHLGKNEHEGKIPGLKDFSTKRGSVGPQVMRGNTVPSERPLCGAGT